MTEDEMVGWHYQLNGLEFEWTPGVGDGQGGLACWDSWYDQIWSQCSNFSNCCYVCGCVCTHTDVCISMFVCVYMYIYVILKTVLIQIRMLINL